MTDVYIIEDHPIVREMLEVLVNGTPGMHVCGSADSGKTALRALSQVGADVVLVDISLPDVDGIELVKSIAAICPEAKALIVSGHAQAVYADRALAAGARGYFVKGSNAPLAEAIHTVLGGAIYRAAEAV